MINNKKILIVLIGVILILISLTTKTKASTIDFDYWLYENKGEQDANVNEVDSDNNLYSLETQNYNMLRAVAIGDTRCTVSLPVSIPKNAKIVTIRWYTNGNFYAATKTTSCSIKRTTQNLNVTAKVYYINDIGHQRVNNYSCGVVPALPLILEVSRTVIRMNVGETTSIGVRVNTGANWGIVGTSSNITATNSGQSMVVAIKAKKAGTGQVRISASWAGSTRGKVVYVYVSDGSSSSGSSNSSGSSGSSGNAGSSGSSSTSSGSGGSVYIPPADTTPPSCTVSANYSGVTNASQISYTIRFSENVTGFDQSDISINRGSIASFTGSGSTYTAVVNTEAAEYTQTFSIAAGKCTDGAGNANTASNTISLEIDRIAPKLEFISASSNNTISSGYASKDNSVTFKFKVTDNKFKNSTLTASDIGLYAGNAALNVNSETVTMTSANITNGIEYTLVLNKLDGDGKLKVSIPANKAFDTAGNGNAAGDSSSNSAINIIIDNTKPEVEIATISGVNQYGYIKNGETATLKIKFSEPVYVAPKVKIAGKDATVTGSSADYTATMIIPANEAELSEGKLSIEISGYSDVVGLVGDTVTDTTDGSKLIYDRTPPKVDNITPNGNDTWAKRQSTVISASDNYTAKKDIAGKYSWILVDESVSNLTNDFTNEAEISKNTDTGKFRIYLQIQDLAGNIARFVTNAFYIDNSVTEVGRVKITKGTEDGEIYKTHEKSSKNEEGGYTKDSLYIKKLEGRDDESGYKKTVYQLHKIQDDGNLVAVGSQTIEDTRIETDGNYKITVTTWDNLDNVDYRYYIIHKGSTNVIYEPNGNNSYQAEISTKVTVTDTLGLTDKIYYEWAKKDEGQPDVINNEVKNGGTVKLSKVEGEYVLYVKVVDRDGNETISKSNVFHIAGKITNVGQMLFKENDEQGKDYEPDTFTKENIYMKIKDHGSDNHGGKVTSTYTVILQGEKQETVVGKYTNESAVLTKEGKYKVVLTSTSELGASTSQEFIVKIDKVAPTITFHGLDDYQTTGKIQVAIKDEGISASGLDMNGLKYYWTRSKKEPSAQDFEGETNDYRGTISSATTTISAPKNVSGIWYLWVLAKDNVGNVAIESNVKIDDDGNVSYVDNEAPIAGTLILKENDLEGEDYTPDTFTKENIYIDLLNGYDADSGVKSNTYTIYKNSSIYKSNLTEETVLTEHGVYTAIVTTVDNSQNKATREYKIKIDKKGPTIEFIPDGNLNYAKVQEVSLNITEPNDESGVNTLKTEAYWFAYDSNKYESLENAWNTLQEIAQDKQIEEVQEQIKEAGLEFVLAPIENNKVKTPSEQTGIYYLYVYTEDNVGNKRAKISSTGYAIDNSKPTKPQIVAKKMEGQREINYYGELTNCDVKVISKGSVSESGVDLYQYSVSRDGGKTWSEYKDATVTKNDEIQGEVLIKDEGVTLIKMKAISQLLDGQNESEETDIITVRIDKTGPKVTFANHENGENGSYNTVENIQVRATVTDDGVVQINENTLRYEWILFNSVEDYQSFDKSTKDIEALKAKMTDKQKAFANGEELPSPAGAKGIYSMFVYAQDILGNETVAYSNYYSLGELTNKGDYVIEDNYILRVAPETKVSDFVSKVRNQIKGNEYRVYNKEQKEITEEQIVTTSSTMTVDGRQYKIIVVGDLNGDGKLDLQDVSKLQFHIAQIKELQDDYKLAADINADKNIDMIDISRMIQIVAGMREN